MDGESDEGDVAYAMATAPKLPAIERLAALSRRMRCVLRSAPGAPPSCPQIATISSSFKRDSNVSVKRTPGRLTAGRAIAFAIAPPPSLACSQRGIPAVLACARAVNFATRSGFSIGVARSSRRSASVYRAFQNHRRRPSARATSQPCRPGETSQRRQRGKRHRQNPKIATLARVTNDDRDETPTLTIDDAARPEPCDQAQRTRKNASGSETRSACVSPARAAARTRRRNCGPCEAGGRRAAHECGSSARGARSAPPPAERGRHQCRRPRPEALNTEDREQQAGRASVMP